MSQKGLGYILALAVKDFLQLLLWKVQLDDGDDDVDDDHDKSTFDKLTSLAHIMIVIIKMKLVYNKPE